MIRSRFGKTLLPKNGLISNVVEAVESGQIEDVYLVPVSIAYDNVAEGIFYEELMGVRKEKENVLGVMGDYGIIKGFIGIRRDQRPPQRVRYARHVRHHLPGLRRTGATHGLYSKRAPL